MTTTYLTFREAIAYANAIGIKTERNTDDSVILELANSEELHFQSNYEEDLSDDTPGEGIAPPSAILVTL